MYKIIQEDFHLAYISLGNNFSFWKSVTMELISVGRKSFGKNFWRIKLSWKKFLDFIIFLEKTSIGKKIFGKTFLWKKFLKLANPWTNFLLEKNSFGKMYIGKKFLKNNFFGKNYLGNFYFGKNPLDIFTGCRRIGNFYPPPLFQLIEGNNGFDLIQPNTTGV